MGGRIGSTIGSARGGLLGLSLAAAMTAIATISPIAAHASTASKSGGTLSYTAAAGETNTAVISLAGGTYTIDDSGATITAGAGCSPVNPNKVTCPASGVTSISANAGNMNDLVWVTTPTSSTLTGADGNDTLIGHNANDILIGCVGDDTLIAGGGADLLFDGLFCTGGGNDSFDGGAGSDGISGGPGTDTATYANRSAPVHVSIDGVANDGEAGEGDDVGVDVENVTGGSGDDNITGSPGNNILRGEGGGDAIAGGDGTNQLVGGTGNDALHGGPGVDSFDGGAGEDEMRALDGVVDSVNCGPDIDFGLADFDDVINPNCEGVELSFFLPPGEDFLGEEFPLPECLPGDAPPEESGIFDEGGFAECLASELGPCASLRIVRRPASLRHGAIGVRVKLPNAAGGVCRAKLRLEALLDKPGKAQPRRVKIGGEPLALRPGRAKRLQVQISRSGRRILHREQHLPARVGIFTRGGDASKITSAVIRIEAPGR